MKQKKYTVVSDDSHTTYEFLSEGPKGVIRKIVQYQKINNQLYNLAFGDWNEKKHQNDDHIRSNNSDRSKVLATVASTVFDFVNFHPEAIIYVRGSTPSRTRLYQMGINSHWFEINILFNIVGFINGVGEPFKQGINYQEFLLTPRINL